MSEVKSFYHVKDPFELNVWIKQHATDPAVYDQWMRQLSDVANEIETAMAVKDLDVPMSWEFGTTDITYTDGTQQAANYVYFTIHGTGKIFRYALLLDAAELKYTAVRVLENDHRVTNATIQ